MATTAEEAGLFGAKYYAENPLYPLDQTLADINIDCVNPWGKTRDIEDISGGNSTLDDLLEQAAARSGRTAVPIVNRKKGTSSEPIILSSPKSVCRPFTSEASRKTTSASRPIMVKRKAPTTLCIIIIRSPTK